MIPQILLDNKEQIKMVDFQAEAEHVKADRAIVHYISTKDVDRGRDIVLPEGIVDNDFKKSPSVWYNHEYRYNDHALPVAKSLWGKVDDKGYLSKTQFATTEFADDVYLLHREGFMNTWSIGFVPIMEKGNVKAGTVEYNKDQDVTVWKQINLLEYSSAPIAMNPNAIDMVKSLRDINFKSNYTKTIVDNIDLELKLNEALKEQEEKLAEIDELKIMVNELIDKSENHEKEILALTNLITKKQNKIIERISVEMPDSERLKRIAQEAVGGISRANKTN